MGSQRVGHNWVTELNWSILSGEGNVNPLQYSCLENPMDRGAWQATVHGVTKSQTRLRHWTIQSQANNSYLWTVTFSSVQSLSRVRLFATPWTAAFQASLSITNFWSLPKFMSIESVMPSNHIILSSPSLLAFNLSQHQGLFKWVSSPHQWPKYWSFSFNISPSNEHSGLISFRMDWLDLLAVQGTLKSLLQHHCSKTSILWHSAFFIVQLSHPYMTTGKTIALTRWTFVDKEMFLLFNMLDSDSRNHFILFLKNSTENTYPFCKYKSK